MKRIAEILLSKNAVRVSIDPPFQWTSGIKSPVYCDNRLMTGYPAERGEIVAALVEQIRKNGWGPDAIAGTATAGIAWAAFVAHEMNLPMVYVRPEPKKHGTGKQIEGHLSEGSNLVLVEDLISTAGSSIKSAEALRREGKAAVLGIVAIMSWELPAARKNLQAAGLAAANLTGFSEIIPLAAKRGDVSEEDIQRIMEFRNDPEGWAEKYL